MIKGCGLAEHSKIQLCLSVITSPIPSHDNGLCQAMFLHATVQSRILYIELFLKANNLKLDTYIYLLNLTLL